MAAVSLKIPGGYFGKLIVLAVLTSIEGIVNENKAAIKQWLRNMLPDPIEDDVIAIVDVAIPAGFKAIRACVERA